MIESTDSFLNALKAARDEKRRDRTLSARDGKLISYVLANPVVQDPRNGRRIQLQTALHAKVRWLWQRQHEWRLDSAIDWSKFIQFLKENWLTIIKYILLLAPFLI